MAHQQARSSSGTAGPSSLLITYGFALCCCSLHVSISIGRAQLCKAHAFKPWPCRDVVVPASPSLALLNSQVPSPSHSSPAPTSALGRVPVKPKPSSSQPNDGLGNTHEEGLSLKALFHLFLPQMDPLHSPLSQPSPLACFPLPFKLMVFSQQQTILTKWVRGPIGPPNDTSACKSSAMKAKVYSVPEQVQCHHGVASTASAEPDPTRFSFITCTSKY